MSPRQRVCVVGAGPQGLTALKNLLDLNKADGEMFEAEILECRSALGGVWRYSEDPETPTTLKSTIGNVTKWRNCYSDFPVNEAWRMAQKEGEIPAYLTQGDTLMYLEQYAKKFDLERHIKFGYWVCGLDRSPGKQKWEVMVTTRENQEPESRLYDKVIVATGQYAQPYMPIIDGIDRFVGQVMHSSAFKSSDPFRGKNVLVVGFSSTAADIATELAGTAQQIYLSHRRGNNIFPRVVKNRPMDQSLTRRAARMRAFAFATAPLYTVNHLDATAVKACNALWKDRMHPKWGFRPAPSMAFCRPIVSDTLFPLIENGTVELVPAIRKTFPSRTIELDDATTISVDAIIFCTGYHKKKDLSTVIPIDEQQSLPRLYHNIFHPHYADSLAYMTYWQLSTGVFEAADLMSMAIAQGFAGRYLLPTRTKIDLEIDRHNNALRSLVNHVQGPISLDAMEKWTEEGPWRAFLQSAGGTGVTGKLGYGWEGWKFWWNERKLCNLLMTGVDSPHVQRLFEGRHGGRPKWSGALDAIQKANQEVMKFEEETARKDPA